MNVEKKNPEFEAVIFDLDGVITRTETIHSAAWKKMFDEYLQKRQREQDELFCEFTTDDYLAFVDGKPRYNGVASFLKSRGIKLPWGTKEDPPGKETICGLGNKKNEYFNKMLREGKVEVYTSSVNLIHDLKKAGVKLGVASSSKNCRTILEVVGLIQLFDAMVDGKYSAKFGLKGKPEPDIFKESCKLLQTSPSESIVVEDAVSGVRAGAKGKFGLTLGVARDDNAEELQENGADWVVNDLKEVNGINGLNDLFLDFKEK